MSRQVSSKKIDNPSARQTTFTKRRDGIVKKASELAVLCDADVGLLIFSPNGRLTSYASHGSVEDIFFRFFDHPNELQAEPLRNQEHLHQALRKFKYEGQLLEKIEKIEALESKLRELSQLKRQKKEKLQLYNPDTGKITSFYAARMHEERLTAAIGRLEQLKAKQMNQPNPDSSNVATAVSSDTKLAAEDSNESETRRTLSRDEQSDQANLSFSSEQKRSTESPNKWAQTSGPMQVSTTQ